MHSGRSLVGTASQLLHIPGMFPCILTVLNRDYNNKGYWNPLLRIVSIMETLNPKP